MYSTKKCVVKIKIVCLLALFLFKINSYVLCLCCGSGVYGNRLVSWEMFDFNGKLVESFSELT